MRNCSVITQVNLKQLHYEIHTCKRLIDFIVEENINLKKRLTDILRENFDINLLDEIESFQNRFIKEDEITTRIKKEIEVMDALLEAKLFDNLIPDNEIIKSLAKLRNNITNAEITFSNLKQEFNIYLSEHL